MHYESPAVGQVADSVQRLKANKSDGDKGLISNMVIKAPQLWMKYLADLLTSMFTHGHNPEI